MTTVSFRKSWAVYNSTISKRNFICVSAGISVLTFLYIFLDYYYSPQYFFQFTVFRLFSVGLGLLFLFLFLKKIITIKVFGYLAICVPVGLLAYMTSSAQHDILSIYFINFSATFVICSFLLTWHWLHTLNVLVIFNIVYLMSLFHRSFTLADLVKYGYLIVISASLISVVISAIRYYSLRSEFILKYKLQLLNTKLKAQNKIVFDANSNLNQFKNIIENSSDGVVLFEIDPHTNSISQMLYENTNFQKLEIAENKNNVSGYLDLFKFKNHKSGHEGISYLLENKFEKKTEVFELNIHTKSGFNLIAETTVLVLESPEASSVLFALFIKDITIKKSNEEKRIKQSLRNYLYTINAVDIAQERERDRFARDLHDGLGQVLTSIKLNLNYLRNFSDDQHKEIWQDTIYSISYSITEMRNIAYGIAPPSLVKFGLISSLKEICNKNMLNSSKPILLHTNLESFPNFLSRVEELNIYRIIQEGINNIIKHSCATNAEISIYKIGKKLIITIQDDGIGFTLNENHGTIGLNSMRARCEIIEAKLSVKNTSGTCIELLLNKSLKNGK